MINKIINIYAIDFIDYFVLSFILFIMRSAFARYQEPGFTGSWLGGTTYGASMLYFMVRSLSLMMK